ncbi:unnamed protein product [Clonostachys rhizophaga]|uniref:Uncharacterized protein n=1 Tax=Clonostachys rhizophaga TaxID=160324 RepID=A0A9N9VLE5_9HYPO|nr:unnamed protein product [Clonostachys rhizophaga]
MTVIPNLGGSCPGQSSFYVCTNKPTRFVGCCAIDPCNTANGYCPEEKLVELSDDTSMAQSRLQIRADEGGLSNVAVAGIAVAATLVGGGLICGLVWWFWRKRYQNGIRSGALPSTSYEPFAGANRAAQSSKGASSINHNSLSVESYHTTNTKSYTPSQLDRTYKYDSLQHTHLASLPQPSPSQWSELSYGAPGGGNALAYSTTDLSGSEYYGAMPAIEVNDEEEKARAELAAGGRRGHSHSASGTSLHDAGISGFTRTYSADMSRAQQPAVGEMIICTAKVSTTGTGGNQTTWIAYEHRDKPQLRLS